MKSYMTNFLQKQTAEIREKGISIGITMNVIRLSDMKNVNLPKGAALALGFFDGVHIGHRSIIENARRVSGDAPVAVWMIDPYEDAAEGSPHDFKNGSLLLTQKKEKLERLKKCGAEYAVFCSFKAIKNMSGEEFVRDIISGKLAASHVVCGFNFRFGCGALCGVSELKELSKKYGILCTVSGAVERGGETVSSSRIRALVSSGNVEGACELLGEPFAFTLPVVHGKKLGRTLGFPTVNQIIPSFLVSPARGVYAARVTLYSDGKKKTYPGAANIGVCPTVNAEALTEAGIPEESAAAFGAAREGHVVCETYISGYRGDLYGNNIKVEFLRMLRGEMRFENLDALTERVRADAQSAEKIYAEFEKGNFCSVLQADL